MFCIHYIKSFENAKVLYGYDSHNLEFVIAYKEVTYEDFLRDKHMMDESRFFIEFSDKFYDIGISLEPIFRRNISILNDNEKDDLILKINELTDFNITDISYVNKTSRDFAPIVYGIQPTIWLIMSGMIGGTI